MKTIKHNNTIYAIIIPSEYKKDGIEFFTPDDYSQQLAYMKHSEGHIIQPHIHNEVPREVFYTQETLLIRKGRLLVNFYDENQNFLFDYELSTGDVILLVSGGQGFRMIEDTEIIEIKQGPYVGEQDKIRFKGIE
jgi:mannose-6-phosphate isomerase-like protein (cupin superfamily)